MAIRNQLKLLLVAGSLLTASLAKPIVERAFEDDDDDDTPLPLVIWHGKLGISPHPNPKTIDKKTITNRILTQAWATPTTPTACAK